jgi:hypothetical protein
MDWRAYMDYKKTHFPFFKEDCINEFGNEKGIKIYDQSSKLFTSMLEKADYRNNLNIKTHFTKNMFPIIACYLTLLDQNFTKNMAYNFSLKISQKAADIQKTRNKSFAKLPFAYKLFKLFTKSIMAKMYTKEGWDTKWIKFDNNEMQINFNKCIYVDMTIEYGCPELCTVFCKNDNIVFSGYEPKIYFKRNGTIAEGSKFCDFHFKRG